MHAETLQYSVCVASLVLIAQVIFLLRCGYTHKYTRTHAHKVTYATDHHTHASSIVLVRLITGKRAEPAKFANFSLTNIASDCAVLDRIVGAQC